MDWRRRQSAQCGRDCQAPFKPHLSPIAVWIGDRGPWFNSCPHDATALPSERGGEVVGETDDKRGVRALIVSIGGTTARGDGSTWSFDQAAGRRAVESNRVIAALGWRALPEPFPFASTPGGSDAAALSGLRHIVAILKRVANQRLPRLHVPQQRSEKDVRPVAFSGQGAEVLAHVGGPGSLWHIEGEERAVILLRHPLWDGSGRRLVTRFDCGEVIGAAAPRAEFKLILRPALPGRDPQSLAPISGSRGSLRPGKDNGRAGANSPADSKRRLPLERCSGIVSGCSRLVQPVSACLFHPLPK
ncbi:MAG: hypothetical protein JWM75_1327 [Sphingomonas bacterium]|nr:hypothetical protein [Sphingomonas bacterium]